MESTITHRATQQPAPTATAADAAFDCTDLIESISQCVVRPQAAPDGPRALSDRLKDWGSLRSVSRAFRDIVDSPPVIRALQVPDAAHTPQALLRAARVANNWEQGRCKVQSFEFGGGHKVTASCAAATPEGVRVAYALENRTLEVRDAGNNLLHGPLEAGEVVKQMTLSGDGRALATVSAGWDANLDVWDLTAPTPASRHFYRQTLNRAPAFSPDGQRLAFISRHNDVYLCDWPAETPSFTHLRHCEHINRLAFAHPGVGEMPDSTKVDLADAAVFASLDVPVATDSTRPHLALGCVNGTLDYRDFSRTPAVRHVLESRHAVYMHNMAHLVGCLVGFGSPLTENLFIRSACFTPDGTMLAASDLAGVVSLWNLQGAKPVEVDLPYREGGIDALAADTTHFVSIGERTLTVWNFDV